MCQRLNATRAVSDRDNTFLLAENLLVMLSKKSTSLYPSKILEFYYHDKINASSFS